MSPLPASRRDDQTLTAFLGEITGSESGAQTGRYRTTGLSLSESGSPAESGMPTGLPTPCSSESYRHNPAVRQESTSGNSNSSMAELTLLVIEMADDIDRAIARGGSLPFIGDHLRGYFREAVRVFGLEAALAEARIRNRAQVECQVMPLPKSKASAEATRTRNAATVSTGQRAGHSQQPSPAAVATP